MNAFESMKDSAESPALHRQIPGAGRNIAAERQHLEIERAACERRLDQLNADLNSTSQELERSRELAETAAQAAAGFLVGIYPELRAPLHDMLGNTALLSREGGLNERQRARVDAVMQAGLHLLEQMNSLQTLSPAPHEAILPDPGHDSLTQDVQPGDAARSLRVLLVDDSTMNRDIAAAFLSADGHRVSVAQHGLLAVKMAAEQDFDVILMDIRMSGMDGFEATRRIRALPSKRGKVPIVALTALSFIEQVEACRQAGMNGHLAKPYSPETLCRAAVLAATTCDVESTTVSDPPSLPIVQFASFKRAGGQAPSEHQTSLLRRPPHDQAGSEVRPQHYITAQPWIDIVSPWSPPPSAIALIGGMMSSHHVDSETFTLRLASVSAKAGHRLLDKKLSCEPPPEYGHFEFHWLLFATSSAERHHGFSATCDLWRWSATRWRSITVPGAQFSPDEMHDQGWRYCGPCAEKIARVEILPEGTAERLPMP